MLYDLQLRANKHMQKLSQDSRLNSDTDVAITSGTKQHPAKRQ